MPNTHSLRSLSVNNMDSRPMSPSAGPPSPTFSATTNASQMNLGADAPRTLITRADLKASLQAFEHLMITCHEYREAMLHMSRATFAFASAMEACSGLKGVSYESGTRLQAASGLHHLMGNHWHVLSATMDSNFEKPLRQYLDDYRTVVSERSASYEWMLREKSRIIRQTESENMTIGRKKQRNLQMFREALAILQRQVDEFDELKLAHYQEIGEHEDEVWDFVQGKVSLVVRSTLDVFDRFASKSSDPSIEPMITAIPDPFDSYGPPKADDEIFSILPPLAILSRGPSSSPSTMTSTPEQEFIPIFAMGAASWMDSTQGYSSSEWAEATSPRSTSPASSGTTSTTKKATSPESSRRHSYPITAKNAQIAPRRSETKLRKVLSAVDEFHPDSNITREASQDTVKVSTSKSAAEDENRFDIETWSRSATDANVASFTKEMHATENGVPYRTSVVDAKPVSLKLNPNVDGWSGVHSTE